MPSHGIYTLANDAVYDQLVALLNSIEANVSPDIPVCVIPYDDNLDRVRQEISTRPNVALFENKASLDRWKEFAHQFVNARPTAQKARQSHPRWTGGRLHRKFAAFDGTFDKFVFYDSDSLAMKPIDDIFEKLEDYDFVFNDWEHIKSRKNAALDMAAIEQSGLLKEAEIRPKLHCSSFFGSKRGLFNPEELALLQARLVNNQEAGWINGQGWWDDAYLFNYMTLLRPLFNFTLSPDENDRTGNCANADPFVEIKHVLYNEDGLKPIHRIHYMGYSSRDFARLCKGEAVDVCYRDIFLYYHFLKHPEQKPQSLKPPNPITQVSRYLKKSVHKAKSLIS